MNEIYRTLTAMVLLSIFTKTGCIRRTSDKITEDYDEIDRRDPPVFINNTRTKVIVAAGKTATLECRVVNIGDRTVSWIRQRDLHILTMGITVYTNDNRIEPIHPTPRVNGSNNGNYDRHHPTAPNVIPSDRFGYHKYQSPDWILNIYHAKVKDTGTYECQINTEPKRSKSYQLLVVVSKARIIGDKDVLVQTGSDINLTCRAEQSPVPPRTVAWYRNGARVNTLLKRGGISVVTESRRPTSNLLISKVTKADAGNYTCAPSNAQADSVMVHVIEGADPRAKVMASSSNSMQHHGVLTYFVPCCIAFTFYYIIRL